MAPIATNHYYDVLLRGTSIMYSGAMAVTEALESLATTCEFELASRPDPRPTDGDALRIIRLNRDTNTGKDVFGGVVTSAEVDSFPHRFLVRGVDQLERFNYIRTGSDLLLTGMTDGQAWMAIADACGVTYDPADIQDGGYVLGEHADVFWHVDDPGSALILELDKIMGMKTLTVGNGRVVRFAYDLAPSASLIQKSYIKGQTANWWKNRKAWGTRNEIQSMWKVSGGNLDCDDGCTCTVWARAIDHTKSKVRRSLRRVGEASFQSDLIQDETLAAAIAQRLMRWYNRIPEIYTLEMQNDPDLHPGSVIGLTDPTYGIEDPTEEPVVILTVDRRGDQMSLTAVGGAPGATGTITTGVEKRCNKTDLDIDWESDFTVPPITVPPIGLDFPWGMPALGGLQAFGPPEEEEEEPGGPLDVSAWVNVYGNWTFPAAGHAYNTSGDDNGEGRAYWTGDGTPYDGSQRVRLRGHVEFENVVTTGAPYENEVGLWISLSTADESAAVASEIIFWFDGGAREGYTSLYGFTDGYQDDCCNTPLNPLNGVDFTLDLNPALATAKVTLDDGSTVVTHTVDLGDWPAEGVYPNFARWSRVNNYNVGIDLTDLTIELGG